MDEIDLINSAIRNSDDQEAWRFIYDRYYVAVKWSFLKYGFVGLVQDDLAQQTFLRMLDPKTKPIFDNLRSFHAWLKCTIYSVAMDKIKSKATCSAEETEYINDIKELDVVLLQETKPNDDLKTQINNALDKLSEKDKKLLILRANGTQFSIIAKETGYSINGIRVYYQRAKEKLKNLLQSEGIIK